MMNELSRSIVCITEGKDKDKDKGKVEGMGEDKDIL